MGLLTVGEPLSWSETKSHAEHVREHGIQQFINIYKPRKHRKDEVLKWGDEIEYQVFKFDHKQQKVRFSLRASTELLKQLQAPEESGATNLSALWRPEFAAYMVEGTPGEPYGIKLTAVESALKKASSDEAGSSSVNQIELDGGLSSSSSESASPSGEEDVANGDRTVNGNIENRNQAMFAFFNEVEPNIRRRRLEVQSLLEEDEVILTISAFPRAGTVDSCWPPTYVDTVDGYSKSLFFPDGAINQGHPRFRTLSKHICERRGTSPNIQLPIYRDVNTPNPFLESFFNSMNINRANLSSDQIEEFKKVAEKREKEVRQPDHVYLDAMGFGMGCCCLQVTFQAANICESRLLYDQLTPLCPIMMALSAASPAFRGFLTDVDCRWSVIAGAVDDRTVAEQTGVNPVTGEKVRRIPKSRYDSVDLYLYPGNDVYNDIDVVYNEKYYEKLKAEGVDDMLAKHIAHLFIRDPLVLFKEKLDIDDMLESDHFENIQSTNWQSMRFKPPPANAHEIGWRVEFRTMEVQLTDKDNAAFVIFIVLLTRLILSYQLDMLIPMSKVEENMKEAQKRDAVRKSKFWFRKDITLPVCVVNHLTKSDEPKRESVCPVRQKLAKSCTKSAQKCTRDTIYSECVQLSIDEIMNGTNSVANGSTNGNEPINFPGLIPLLNVYLDSMGAEIDAETRCTLNGYLRIISERAAGTAPTPARLIRDYITHHSDYKNDSVVSEKTTFELLRELSLLQSEKMSLQDLVAKVETMKKNKA